MFCQIQKVNNEGKLVWFCTLFTSLSEKQPVLFSMITIVAENVEVCEEA